MCAAPTTAVAAAMAWAVTAIHRQRHGRALHLLRQHPHALDDEHRGERHRKERARELLARVGLDERRNHKLGQLSGGEQQMLTLCRTLMGDPDLIIIDEPTEGLAPKIVELVAEYLQELKRRGVSVLLIEQKLTIAMQISDRCLVMGHGAIVFEGTPTGLRSDAYIRKEWLEV